MPKKTKAKKTSQPIRQVQVKATLRQDFDGELSRTAQGKKDWVAKLHDSKDLPKVVEISGKMSKRWGTGTVVIPAPIEVDEIMRKVPQGSLITINEIREFLAKKHQATIGCPMTCGIFAWIAAHTADQEWEKGKKNTTPYWRTLKSDGSINPKYPGGVNLQKKLLKEEGHKVVQKGKNYLVENYEKAIVKP